MAEYKFWTTDKEDLAAVDALASAIDDICKGHDAAVVMMALADIAAHGISACVSGVTPGLGLFIKALCSDLDAIEHPVAKRST